MKTPRRVTAVQVKELQRQLNQGASLRTAAMRANMDRKSARKYRALDRSARDGNTNLLAVHLLMDRIAPNLLHYGEEGTYMSRRLELPDPVYDALVEAAKASGETPVGWIAARLPRAGRGNGRSALPTPDGKEIAQANARLREHMVDLGHAVGCDNEQIDADLAREYGDDHADLHRLGKGDE